jgi:HK97 family phage portal protein
METQSLICASWASEPQAISWDNPEEWVFQWASGGMRSDAGVSVTPLSALSHTPIWMGLQLLGGDCGSLPMQMKSVSGETKTLDTRHAAASLLGVQPSRYQAPNTWFETVTIVSILYGNAVCWFPKNNAGRPLTVRQGGGFEMLPPNDTKPEYDDAGRLWIMARMQTDRGTTKKVAFDPQEVFHIRGLSTDGFWGLPLWQIGKNTIGHGLGLQKHANRTFQNAAKPDFMVSFPGRLNQESIVKFKDKWIEENAGLDNRGRMLVVDNGATATPLSMSLEDAVFVELSKLDRVDAASLLGIPAAMLNATDRQTFSNSVEQNLQYINRALGRIQNKYNEEALLKLLSVNEQSRYVFEWDNSRLLRGPGKEEAEMVRSLRASKVITANEARQRLGLNPSDEENADLLENPFTGDSQGDAAGGDPDSTQESEEMANRLKKTMRKEDVSVMRAAQREKNLIEWIDGYYKTTYLNELRTIAPEGAEQYCSDRHGYWMTVAGAVNSMSAFRDIVQAQHNTQPARVAGLINKELLPCVHV